MLQWFVAELVGTAILATAVGVVITVNSTTSLAAITYATLYTPFVVGIIIAVLVATLGTVTGGHFNPAVSVAMYAYRKINGLQLGTYLVGQIAGAMLGIQVITHLLTGFTPDRPSGVGAAAFTGEFLGTAIIAMAIMYVVIGKINESVGPLYIGLSFVVALTIAMVASGGILNPALAIGMFSYQIIYLIVPFFGALAGAGLVVLLQKDR